jgi:pimeloyl-ACP methyl ester carboxylesterase
MPTTPTVTPDHRREERGTRMVNGVRLYYEEHGTGAPILCIHGAGSSALVWSDAVRELARFGRVISYDRRGCTRSERPQPYDRTSVGEHADDAAVLLESLAGAPAVVIGRSYGGTVATDLALRYPDRVRALVLLEGDAPRELAPTTAEWLDAVADRLRRVAAHAGVDAVAEALIGEVLGDSAWSSFPEELRRMFTQNGPAMLAELQGEWWLQADAAALATIEQPVLLVAATDSRPELREPTEALASALPNARTALVAGGHLISGGTRGAGVHRGSPRAPVTAGTGHQKGGGVPEAEVNGVGLYYELEGSGEPLALVHGSWGDATSWRFVVPGLAERFRVLTYDRRGHSRSDPAPATPGSIDEDGDDLAALLEALDLAPAHVATNSWGGNIALRLATRRADVFRSLSCHEPPVWSLLEGDAESQELLQRGARSFEEVGRRIAAGDHEGGARHFVEEVAFGPGAWEHELPAEMRAVFVRNAPTYLDELQDPNQLNVDPEALARLEIPVRLTEGTESPPVFPRVIDRLATLIPRVTREIIDGAAHVPHLSNPQRYMEVTTRALLASV